MKRWGALVVVGMLAVVPSAHADAVDDAITAWTAIAHQTPPPVAPADVPATDSCAIDSTGCPHLHTGLQPWLGIAEARESLQRVYLDDMRDMNLRVKITRCHRMRRNRVDCTLVMRPAGSVCRSPAHVVEGDKGYTDYMKGFTCHRR